jgi:hypothetical protein
VQRGVTINAKKINTKHGEGNNINCKKGSINKHEEVNNSECEEVNSNECKEENNK